MTAILTSFIELLYKAKSPFKKGAKNKLKEDFNLTFSGNSRTITTLSEIFDQEDPNKRSIRLITYASI